MRQSMQSVDCTRGLSRAHASPRINQQARMEGFLKFR
jgi:hypothetical protein